MRIIKGKKLKLLINKIANITIAVPQIQKSGKLTCWAGCYRMIDSYQKKDAAFKKYLELKNPACKLFTCEIIPCNECDNARKNTEIIKDLVKIGYGNSSHFQSHVDTSFIRESMIDKSPLMAYKDYGTSVGHFVIITGIITKFFFTNTLLLINDPDKQNRDIIDIADFCLKNGTWKETRKVKK